MTSVKHFQVISHDLRLVPMTLSRTVAHKGTLVSWVDANAVVVDRIEALNEGVELAQLNTTGSSDVPQFEGQSDEKIVTFL